MAAAKYSRMQRKRQSPAGFTLVEIMIVAAVIGLLTTLALPLFAKARRTSLRQKCVLNQRCIFEAVTRYEMDYNTNLANIRNNGVQIRAQLLANGYMNPINNFDCPSSAVKDFDDYQLIYAGRDLVSTRCTILPSDHAFPN